MQASVLWGSWEETLQAVRWLRALGWDSPGVGVPSGTALLCVFGHVTFLLQPLFTHLQNGETTAIPLVVLNIKCSNLAQWLKILATIKITWKTCKKTKQTQKPEFRPNSLI